MVSAVGMSEPVTLPTAGSPSITRPVVEAVPLTAKTWRVLSQVKLAFPASVPPSLYCTALSPPTAAGITPVSAEPSPANAVAVTVPTTSRAVDGVEVPMPTLP